MSAAVTVTKDNVESTIKDNDTVLLDFWAAWCGPCRFFAPIFEAAAADNPDIAFGKIDTEAQRELAAVSTSRRSQRWWRSATERSCSPSPARCPPRRSPT